MRILGVHALHGKLTVNFSAREVPELSARWFPERAGARAFA
ncbi:MULTISPECIES: hypothetical protein [unclassified Streptomyces]|nr:hypothetical protein [Streptomyces sp. CB09001]